MKTRGVTLLPLLFLLIFPSNLVSTIVGDLDNNGVTSVDALIALKMAVGKIPVNLSADMDEDGEVTSIDTYRILLSSLGREDDLSLQLNRMVKKI